MPGIETRFWASVDKSQPNGCWIWTGPRQHTGYGRFSVRGKYLRAHRYAYTLLIGPIPDGLDLDHACNTILCVNPDHLRPCSRAQNCLNTTLKSCNSSGFKGVTWNQKCGKWQAQIKCEGKNHYLGLFDDAEEAYRAYCCAATEFHKEFANFGNRNSEKPA